MVGGQVILYTHFLLPCQDTKLADPKPLALNELTYQPKHPNKHGCTTTNKSLKNVIVHKVYGHADK
jgi:hypothetical protein